MNRPSFRSGLVLGVLGGAAVAVARSLQGRRAAATPAVPAPSTEWPPLVDLAPSPVARATPAPAPEPPTVPAPFTASTPAPAPIARPAAADPVLVAEPNEDSTPAPEPEAVPAADRIAEARQDEPLVSSGEGDEIPPAPEPTFGTAPDQEAAAEAPVPVATPIATAPDEVLEVPKRAPMKKRATPATTTAAARTTSTRAVEAAPAPAPAPAKEAAAQGAAIMKPAAAAPWIVPSGDGCPGSHPVKAKLSSRIFHLPGMFAYDRTNPDRCYVDGAAAEADGLRPAKR